MPKRHIESLVSSRIRLRLLEEADLPMTLAWRNQDHIRQWFLHSDIITPEQHAAWFRGYRDRDDDFVFVIEETEALNRPIGQVALYHVDAATERAEFGRLLIGEAEAAGRGLTRQATACLVAEGFSGWGLREIYLEVKAQNAPAIAVYRACGFRETATRDGAIHMSVTRSSAAE